MHDAWAAYSTNTVGYLYNENAVVPGGFTLESARDESISYAAYRVLSHRYAFSANSTNSLSFFNDHMAALNLDTNITTTVGATPSALGNRIAAAIIGFGTTDGANEDDSPGYTDPSGYLPVNEPLILSANDTPSEFPLGWTDMNRWQPLAFDSALTQNGLEAEAIQRFVGPHWGSVRAFGLDATDQNSSGLYFDPGLPPQLGGNEDLQYKTNAVDVLMFSFLLDPTDPATINLSPGTRGHNTLGFNDGTGHATNPATGQAYTNNIVLHADYGRCVAEFWADGPDSETPPGHWNVLANEVTDQFIQDSTPLQIGGTGPVVDLLEWEVKLYFSLNAALHNTAVAIWGIKAHYDYVRPITAIRYMCLRGQSSEPLASDFHPEGILLVSNLVERITASTSAVGQRHAHLAGNIGEIAVHAWAGEPDDPTTQASGRAWIPGKTWLPYQRDTFVTPAFAGYVSGHSGFSRAAAEVMTLFTGDPFFPGGLASHTIAQNALIFEQGPTSDVTLQWATYYDAADEAGLSRLYGGIHVSPDDGPGRIVGSEIGIAAFNQATSYWDGRILDQFAGTIAIIGATVQLTYPTLPGYSYELFSGTSLINGLNTSESPNSIATDMTTIFSQTGSENVKFFRLKRTAP